MTDLYDTAKDDLYYAAEAGNLEQVTLLLEQGVDKNQIGGEFGDTALSAAAEHDHLDVVRYLVEQGADMERGNTKGACLNPLHYASLFGRLDVVRYLLEQGANRDKASFGGMTPLHFAAMDNHLQIAKLLMVYGADLNARNNNDQLPIDVARTEEIKQAIRDEPRRRMDHGHKRATEQDRHPKATVSGFTQQEEEGGEVDEHSNKRPRLDEGAVAEEGKIAEEDEDSEPSDEDDD